jgi:hypothetical protein
MVDGKFSLLDLMDIPLLEILEVVHTLIEKHGPDAKLAYIPGSSLTKVMTYKPTYNDAQHRQQLIDFATEFDRKSAENVRQRYETLLAKKNKK